ncbi:response regulator transcription factor [Oxynema aestuarii]|jgi:DNA-binding NarL/FixJ family response regulator|uniref:Response regulator transcription factor n=1 Tax=Oxynema aestuarii AP17 TaxID=2064643 RepID=A0A6H1U2D0_9CYAN|nr:DNA-binding response regulator [Oxynema aestuarii]QIZ72981.1 response regulator transcription factor [Oxynema aestuarii AP17]RMH75142.1 MAG: DNA-binding response regulator [Cyanobacteria bacterium J007]
MLLTILVVDDDPGTRLAIGEYLEMSGYMAIAAANGREALTMVERHQPHLMVTDIVMPQMDGYELVRQIRKKPAFRLLPVIFLTARTNTQERILGYQLGCDVYLAKPFELEELGAVIRNLLERASSIAQATWRAQETLSSPVIEAEWRFAYKPSPETGGAAAYLSPEGDPPSDGRRSRASAPSWNQAQDRNRDGEGEAEIVLSDRERQVLSLLTEGLSNAQIGDRLHLSPRTIEKYVSSLLRKTATKNRAQLVGVAIERALL